jgi:hypothetical protein
VSNEDAVRSCAACFTFSFSLAYTGNEGRPTRGPSAIALISHEALVIATHMKAAGEFANKRALLLFN